MPDRPTIVPPPFSCDVCVDGANARIHARGELDLAACGRLRIHLRAAYDAGCEEICVDLAEVTFIDSSGLALLVEWARRAGRDGRVLTFARGPETVHRVFELTRVAEHLAFEVDAA